jgi:hypothetical protein
MNDANALFDDFQQIERRQAIVAVSMRIRRHITGYRESGGPGFAHAPASMPPTS